MPDPQRSRNGTTTVSEGYDSGGRADGRPEYGARGAGAEEPERYDRRGLHWARHAVHGTRAEHPGMPERGDPSDVGSLQDERRARTHVDQKSECPRSARVGKGGRGQGRGRGGDRDAGFLACADADWQKITWGSSK